MPIALPLTKTRALYLPPIFFCGYSKTAGQKILWIFAWFSANIPISDSQMETIFDSQIQSFDERRLIFWILGINTPISYCVQKNFGSRNWRLSQVGSEISDSQIKTIFDSKIQSFDARRLIFWILGINEPISHCVKNNWSQGAPSLKT